MLPLRWNGSITAQHGHFVLGEICVVYLEVVLQHAKPWPETDKNIKDFAFLDYSAPFWPDNFREANVEHDAVMTSLALRLCDPEIKGYSIWSEIHDRSNHDFKVSSLRPTLNIASILGIQVVVKLLLARSDIDVNSKDYYGMAPLS